MLLNRYQDSSKLAQLTIEKNSVTSPQKSPFRNYTNLQTTNIVFRDFTRRISIPAWIFILSQKQLGNFIKYRRHALITKKKKDKTDHAIKTEKYLITEKYWSKGKVEIQYLLIINNEAFAIQIKIEANAVTGKKN